jgi:NAD(P)-dependent dehydrogenase (short-subunit alcohol dehydrogenase family)
MSKKVLITAGASGIGKVMAEAFSNEGFDVWIADVDKEAINKCPTFWKSNELDVRDEKAVSELFENIKSSWGSLDVLCANAGIKGPTARVEDVNLDEWKECLGINLDGTFLFAKYAAPIFKNQKAGSLIITSSTAGLYGFTHRSPYVTSKWGVIGLMKTLAIELGPFNVRVNAICPGSVEGDRLERVIEGEIHAKGMTREEIYNAYSEGTSMKKLIKASDIANMAIFLSGQNSNLVSGQVIAIDGHTEVPDPKI